MRSGWGSSTRQYAAALAVGLLVLSAAGVALLTRSDDDPAALPDGPDVLGADTATDPVTGEPVEPQRPGAPDGGDPDQAPGPAPPSLPPAQEQAGAEGERWVEVASLSGRESSRSEPFALSGRDARLRFALSGPSSARLTIRLVREGGAPEAQSPLVNAQGPGSGETRLPPVQGSYFLVVESSGAGWTVAVEERT